MEQNSIINTLKPGTIVPGKQTKYTVESVLGAGGFGITYLVSAEILYNNIPLIARFALKEHFISDLFERKDSATNVSYISTVADKVQASIKDFVSEATRLIKVGLDHPNIVKVNEVFYANNTAYYVMEYLEGKSLSDLIKTQGRLSEEQTLSIMTPIIQAVGALHRFSLTHLDIKPQNIMLTNSPSGIRPVLIDFGLAKHYSKDGSPTSTLNTLGCSHGYSPLEQYVGITSFSPTADIYALGATLYHCLTGKIPVRAIDINRDELAAELKKVASTTVQKAILNAMMPTAKQRTQSVDILLSEIGMNSISEKTEYIPSHSSIDKTELIKQGPEIIQGTKTSLPDQPRKQPIFASSQDNSAPASPVNAIPKKSISKPFIFGSLILGALVGLVLFFILGSSDVEDKDSGDALVKSSVNESTAIVDSIKAAQVDSLQKIELAKVEAQKKAEEDKKAEMEKKNAEIERFEASITPAYNEALTAQRAMNNGKRFHYVVDCDCYDYEYEDDEYLAVVIAKANKAMNSPGWSKYKNATPEIKKKCNLIQSVKSKASYIRSKAAGWA